MTLGMEIRGEEEGEKQRLSSKNFSNYGSNG